MEHDNTAQATRTDSFCPSVCTAASAGRERRNGDGVRQQLRQRVLHLWVWYTLHRVQRRDNGRGLRRAAHQLHDQLAAVATEDAVLVLHKHRVVALL